MNIKNCRLCQGNLSLILDLGKLPIVNYFPSESEITKEKKYPLEFCVCQSCGLAQLGSILAPENLFRKYHYISGASKPLVEHLKNLAQFCVTEFKISKNSKVLDIGCNDGSFLSEIKKIDSNIFGVDPSLDATKLAEERGIKVINQFFNNKLAKNMASSLGQFDLIAITHTLANISDLKDFIQGVKRLLKKRGVLVIEVGSLPAMLSNGQFDAIYHEHFSYFSFSSLQDFLNRNGLEIFKAETNFFHGGSIRVFATHASRFVKKLQFSENIQKQDYTSFAQSTLNFKERVAEVLGGVRGGLVGFGAPAKGVTLINFCQLSKDKIPFIVDSTPHKQGKFLPGMHIPIYPENYLEDKEIKNYLMLAWNYRDEVLRKIKNYSKNSRVVIPFPQFEIFAL